MNRKNITIRSDQSEWIRERGLNLSRFVQERLDEEMGPSDAELEEAYRRNEERNRRVYEEWEGTSREANEYLGDAPAVGDWGPGSGSKADSERD